jgi:hypothetical protein
MDNKTRGSQKFTTPAIVGAVISWAAAAAIFLATPADATMESCIEDCEGCLKCVYCGETSSGTKCYRKADPE